jgi:hypothetical protein
VIRTTRPGLLAILLTVAALIQSPMAFGQGGSEQLGKILTDPDKLEEFKKERLRPPIEFFRSQIMPNDILPYIKANHWAMVGLEMRANHEDYDGSLQTRPVMLADQPHEMIYRRDARLIKAQRARLTVPIFLPRIPKEIGFQLIRPEAIRQDEEWPAALKPLEPHQQMIVVLSKAANDQFARWSQSRSTLPSAADKGDSGLLDKQRYYRLVLPLEPDKPLLSPHPLTWSPISHVIWDGMAPEIIGTGQQQAMVDWLHWGGQLVIVGGAGPAFTPLRESFLAPYLPAEPSGENVMRSGAELTALSEAYPPSAGAREPDDSVPLTISVPQAWEEFGRRYKPPAPIRATEKKPLFVTALTPKPGATVIPLGGEGNPPLGVEWKVGRGRVLMLAISLSDPDLIGWLGYDTMLRRVVLRRPEERQLNPMQQDRQTGAIIPPHYEPLNGNDLTTVRYVSRDLGAPTRQAVDDDGKPITSTSSTSTTGIDLFVHEVPVGEWLDSAALPSLSRSVLEKASGIEIPGRAFVLKVILAYILVLVPLNYLICRYLLGRREWAWVVVPTLSLAFAIGVERAAAYDVGFDSSCDEIDLIETHGDYPRGHISRFASLYATGRVKFTISYPGPNGTTALALPLATGRSLRGEDSTQSSFETQPVPTLSGFQVQPRSLAMFRAEQLATLPGTVTLTPPGEGPRSVVNESGLDLKDAWVIRIGSDKEFTGVSLGSVAQGAKIPLGAFETIKITDKIVSEEPTSHPTPDLAPGPFLDLLRERSVAVRPEEAGELRLIAWAEKTLAGQTIDPPVDRHRGFTLVVAHLQPSPLLDPASPRYNALALGRETPPPILPIVEPDPNSPIGMGRPRIGRPGVAPAAPRSPNRGGPAAGSGAAGSMPPSTPPSMGPTTAPALPDSPPSPPTATPNAPENPRP